MDQDRQVVWSTPNVNWVVAALTDPDFSRAAIDNELCAADGMPLVWAARLLDLPILERVAGSGLIEKRLRVEGASSYIKRLFRYNCADFLLTRDRMTTTSSYPPGEYHHCSFNLTRPRPPPPQMRER